MQEQTEKQAEAFADFIENEREELGDDIYKSLEDSYYADLEEENIIENIKANNYEYLEDGSLYS